LCPAPLACEAGACCTTEGSMATSEAPCCTGLSECADGVCRADCCAGVTCDECETCEGGACVTDPGQVGDACGDPGNNLICLASGECGDITCSDVEHCPAGCICSGGPPRCFTWALYCAASNQLCTDTSQCPQGFYCLPCSVVPTIISRCNPLCTG
jgi:hypothetical protein